MGFSRVGIQRTKLCGADDISSFIETVLTQWSKYRIITRGTRTHWSIGGAKGGTLNLNWKNVEALQTLYKHCNNWETMRTAHSETHFSLVLKVEGLQGIWWRHFSWQTGVREYMVVYGASLLPPTPTPQQFKHRVTCDMCYYLVSLILRISKNRYIYYRRNRKIIIGSKPGPFSPPFLI